METPVRQPGWREAGERSLSEEEVQLLRRLARRYTHRAVLWAICTPLMFFGFLLGLATASGMIGRSDNLFMLLIFGPACLFAVSYLLMRDASGRSAGLKRDVKRGVMHLYEGRLDAETRGPVETRLLRDGLLLPDEQASQTLEMLPESGMLWRVNDTSPHKMHFDARAITLARDITSPEPATPRSWIAQAGDWIWFVIGWCYLSGIMVRSLAIPGFPAVRYAAGALLGLAGIIAVVGIHEAGHLVAGWLVGLRFVECRIGPLHFRRTVTGLRLGWCGLGGYNSGFAMMIQRGDRHFRLHQAIHILGGPLASLATGIALVLCARGILVSPAVARQAHEAFYYLALVSGIHFVFSAFPVTEPENGFANDAAQFLWMWKSPERVLSMRTIVALMERIVDGQRPREWDGNLMNEAVQAMQKEPDIWGSLLLFYHHLDARRLGEAENALALHTSGANQPVLQREMAFYHGLYAHDAAEARRCLDNATAVAGDTDWKRAEAAVLMAEGKPEDALSTVKAAARGLKWEYGAGLASAKKEWLDRIGDAALNAPVAGAAVL